jgi:hypothetical protein
MAAPRSPGREKENLEPVAHIFTHFPQGRRRQFFINSRALPRIDNAFMQRRTTGYVEGLG